MVSTTLGRTQGFEADDIIKFLGVPFAKPPLGELRFRPPVVPDPWLETFEASEFGQHACSRNTTHSTLDAAKTA